MCVCRTHILNIYILFFASLLSYFRIDHSTLSRTYTKGYPECFKYSRSFLFLSVSLTSYFYNPFPERRKYRASYAKSAGCSEYLNYSVSLVFLTPRIFVYYLSILADSGDLEMVGHSEYLSYFYRLLFLVLLHPHARSVSGNRVRRCRLSHVLPSRFLFGSHRTVSRTIFRASR